MPAKLMLSTAVVLVANIICTAQENQKPIELSVLKGYVGTWDAEIEVWPAGLDSPSIKFKGVETNRAYGEHWIASDFDSEFMGETMKVHSIVGYDLNKKRMVGTVIDHGPYSASMTGDYDPKSKTISWTTEAKGLDGKPMIQKTSITEKSADERLLILSVQKGKDEFVEFMHIKFVRRKKAAD